ncbi:MAG: alpha/beta hydrolase [Mesorhizobium sp.]|nr:alpha/beta hydrolase [Mesorhizobium sp.]
MPTFLLVHGSWHGPWCWDLLRPALERRGYGSVTIDLPSCGADPARLGTLADDAATVSAAAAAIPGDVVVVGHSYGGAVITEATYGPNVRRLVYLGAFMPDTGRTFVSYLPPGDFPPYVGLRDDGSSAVPDGQSVPAFYADCDPGLANWATGQLRLQSQRIFGHPITTAAWRSLPSTYLVLTQDNALPPDFQRMFAAQASEVREFVSSHSPFLSRPDDLAELLISIAAGKVEMKRTG